MAPAAPQGAASGGLGGKVTATIPVALGETLAIFVGGEGREGQTKFAGRGGFNGGGDGGIPAGDSSTGGDGGGGASDIREGGNTLGNRIVIAGGGETGGKGKRNGNRDDAGGSGGRGGSQLRGGMGGPG
ncbi:MAG: glycine-rich protein, partial [Candidatus Cybelea sp.]